tara:strand:- start:21067 stop:21414 length:348 start_codon:yes stop_codon:yes gene_type:complete
MPKQSYELTVFNEGIISHPDPEDLNINAATYSVNLDPIAPAGTLGGKKEFGVAANLTEPHSTVKLLLDQKIGTGNTIPTYIMVYYTPPLGANGFIETNARVGFVEDFYDFIEGDN